MRKTIGQNPLDQLQQLLVFDRYHAWKERLGELGTHEEGTVIFLDYLLALFQEHMSSRFRLFLEDAVVDSAINPDVPLRKGEDAFKIVLEDGDFELDYPAIIKQLLKVKDVEKRVGQPYGCLLYTSPSPRDA